MPHPPRTTPNPGQESVWDYPRPPKLEPSPKTVTVEHQGITIAETQHSYRVLETSHPPVYYIALADIQSAFLIPSTRHSFCEWKGQANYYHLKIGNQMVENVGWFYAQPTANFAAIQNHVAFYPSKVDACFVDGEKVSAQPGDFYGGWITADIVEAVQGRIRNLGLVIGHSWILL